ncbi:MAG: CocE/NonD family hydrolase [Pseudomonadota bacterium]
MAYEEIETVWIPMPDGVKLAARVFLPPDAIERPAPAVLEFLPYRRRDATSARDEATYPAYAAEGVAGVRVDLRGTGDSGGHFDDEYSEQELSDAETVIAWIAAQPWCSGAVGMMGISWGGFNAFQVAARRPSALKAVISIASTVDRFADDIHFKGGAMMSSNLYWATQMLGRAALPPDAAVVGPEWRAQWLSRLQHVPSLAFRWHQAQRRDTYWTHGSICEDFAAFTIPSLVIAGWADGYRNTPWKARSGMGDRVRAITGPWVHLYPHFAAPAPRMDFLARSLGWWKACLNGAQDALDSLPPHTLWLEQAPATNGTRDYAEGRWIATDQRQAAQTTETFYLAPGQLRDTPSQGSANVQTPLTCGTCGGEYFTQNPVDLPGDQADDDDMSECFDTAPLNAALEIIGEPRLELPVSLDASNGHLIARLCDVRPDGSSHRVSMGILNLAHRDGSAEPKAMTPGRAEFVTITFDATAYRVQPGHRLRLALSTSYFPFILPLPEPVALTIQLSQARLHLPRYPFQDIHVPDTDDPRPAYPKESAGSAQRRVERNPESGRVTVSVTSKSGRTRHPGHGMIWEDERDTRWTILPDDPLSLTGEERCAGMRLRQGMETRVEATGRLKVSARHWILETRLTAFEDGAQVFGREWSDQVPRDHM